MHCPGLQLSALQLVALLALAAHTWAQEPALQLDGVAVLTGCAAGAFLAGRACPCSSSCVQRLAAALPGRLKTNNCSRPQVHPAQRLGGGLHHTAAGDRCRGA